ncbi:MAG: aminotransferase class III-fold pyridoxal phosphate-dependent enzyme, partial [Alphaproteobacteria bacterium]
QMRDLNYLAPVMTAPPVVGLAEKLQSLLGYEAHVYFSASGSEANETAFKIARQYHLQSGKAGERRYKIIARYRAYHGNTLGTMTATGQAERKLGYEPGAVGFLHVMPPYPYRRHPKLSIEEHGAAMAEELEETIIHEGAESVAAVIMEPIISGGGVLVPPDNYLPAVREICDRHGVLLILDEVVSGFGRTGEMFGQQHWGVQADIVTFAKGLASGYMPIAATVARADVFERFLGTAPMDHFRQVNTYGGHTVACAVALKNIEIIEREGLVGNSASMGNLFRDRLAARIGNHPRLGEIRGRGLLTGIELVSDREARTPLGDAEMNKVIAAAGETGVLIGRNGNTIPGRCNVLLIAPPLVIDEEEIGKVVDAVATGLDAAG